MPETQHHCNMTARMSNGVRELPLSTNNEVPFLLLPMLLKTFSKCVICLLSILCLLSYLCVLSTSKLVLLEFKPLLLLSNLFRTLNIQTPAPQIACHSSTLHITCALNIQTSAPQIACLLPTLQLMCTLHIQTSALNNSPSYSPYFSHRMCFMHSGRRMCKPAEQTYAHSQHSNLCSSNCT